MNRTRDGEQLHKRDGAEIRKVIEFQGEYYPTIVFPVIRRGIEIVKEID